MCARSVRRAFEVPDVHTSFVGQYPSNTPSNRVGYTPETQTVSVKGPRPIRACYLGVTDEPELVHATVSQHANQRLMGVDMARRRHGGLAVVAPCGLLQKRVVKKS